MKERLSILMIVALAVGISAPTAHADFTLTLQSGSNSMTITDNDARDLDSRLGVLSFMSVAGDPLDNWVLNATVGTSKPFTGPETDAPFVFMDLFSLNATTNGGGVLGITLTDTGFDLLPAVGDNAVLISDIGGTIQQNGDTVAFTQTLTRDDGSSVALSFSSFVGPGGFSGTMMGAAPVSGPFSLTEEVVITHQGSGQTSLDASSTVVPVPAAVLLGFLGLGAAGLKLRRFA